VRSGPGLIQGTPHVLIGRGPPGGTGIGTFLLTQTNIYRLLSAWTIRGRERYRGSQPWSVAQYGALLYAVNGVDPIQRLSIESGTVEDVPDLPLLNLTAKSIAVVREFVVIGDVFWNDGVSREPQLVRWSGIRRPESWARDASGTQADQAFMSDIGNVQAVVGGAFGLILGTEGLKRMDYQGPPIPFRFETLETDIGCELSRSVVKVGDKVFWWSRRGWRMSTGGPSEPIGVGKVDNFFRRRMNFGSPPGRLSALALPDQPVVLWAYVSVDSPDDWADEVLAYNYERGWWTRGRFHCQVLGTAGQPSPVTDDPATWPTEFTDEYDGLTDGINAVRLFPAAMARGYLCGLQTDYTTPGEFVTTEREITPGRTTRVTRVLPLVHAAPYCDVEVLSRDTQKDDQVRTRGPFGASKLSGTVPCLATGRYMRFHLITPGYQRAQGVQLLEFSDGGVR
jgi:hypothetical protein